MRISLPTLQDQTISYGYRLESFGGSSTFGPDIWSSSKVIHVRSSLTCQVDLLDSLVMINLFEGARAWYNSVAGETRAIFSLPQDAELLYKPRFLHMVFPC